VYTGVSTYDQYDAYTCHIFVSSAQYIFYFLFIKICFRSNWPSQRYLLRLSTACARSEREAVKPQEKCIYLLRRASVGKIEQVRATGVSPRPSSNSITADVTPDGA
jgi:hypothetical protein